VVLGAKQGALQWLLGEYTAAEFVIFNCIASRASPGTRPELCLAIVCFAAFSASPATAIITH
jgi:hypothetical protein